MSQIYIVPSVFVFPDLPFTRSLFALTAARTTTIRINPIRAKIPLADLAGLEIFVAARRCIAVF